MPIPSLPIEIVGEIASHLHYVKPAEYRLQAEAGRSLSLVCRMWYPLGQALCWHSIVVKIDAASSLCAHFALHPHLSRLVRYVRQRRLKPNNAAENRDLDFRALASLISETVEIRKLVVIGVSSRVLPEVLLAASLATRLRLFHLVLEDPVIWSSDLTSIVADGFRMLSNLSLEFGRISAPTERTQPAIPFPGSLPVNNLTLEWRSEPIDTAYLVKTLLSSFDQGSLRTCKLVGSTVGSSILTWLEGCRNLQHLTLLLASQEAMITLVSHLPRMTTIELLVLNSTSTDSVMESPIGLNEFLPSLPPNLRRIVAREIIFLDAFSIPQLQERSSEIAGRWMDTSYPDDTVNEGLRLLIPWTALSKPNQWYLADGEYTARRSV